MPTTIRVAELLARLEAHAEPPRHWALASDGDGTLWRGDIGEALFFAALSERWLKEAAREPLATEARAARIDEAGDAHAIARRLFDAYQAGRYDEARTFSMMSWCFAGWTARELEARAREVLDAFGFEAALRPAMQEVLAWADARGVPVWLVSASPEAVVLAAAQRLGIPTERVVAMRVVQDDGVLLPRLALAPSYAEGKLARLRARTSSELLAAFGDSTYDLALLRAAEIAVAVSPTPSLADALASLPHGVALED